MSTKDKTFSSFNTDQAAVYASGRGFSYPNCLYEAIFDFHADQACDTVLDVGTGPGKVVFDLLPRFSKAFGCDSSAAMIDQAKKDAEGRGLAGKTGFTVTVGEKCAEAFPRQRVDLVTVAMAVHWFDMPAFYTSAAKALKPGGTLAMWTCSSVYVHPSVPNHEEIQRIMFNLERDILGPYTTEGNMLPLGAYDKLELPWSNGETAGLFDESAFQRIDWDLGGVPSAAPKPDGSSGPFMYDKETPIASYGAAVNSSSMVIRWREAHPDKANTEENPVKVTVKRLREANGGKESLRMSPSTTLLLLRRSSVAR